MLPLPGRRSLVRLPMNQPYYSVEAGGLLQHVDVTTEPVTHPSVLARPRSPVHQQKNTDDATT
jgi:hypothetical protein